MMTRDGSSCESEKFQTKIEKPFRRAKHCRLVFRRRMREFSATPKVICCSTVQNLALARNFPLENSILSSNSSLNLTLLSLPQWIPLQPLPFIA